MKIEICPKESEFRPFTISLTFESKDEAKMWARLLENGNALMPRAVPGLAAFIDRIRLCLLNG